MRSFVVAIALISCAADSFGSFSGSYDSYVDAGSFTGAEPPAAVEIVPVVVAPEGANLVGEGGGPCGDAYSQGKSEPPFAGFTTCQVAALQGMCADEANGPAMTNACRMSCGLCAADAVIQQPQACDYILHIESKDWGEEISWVLDPESEWAPQGNLIGHNGDGSAEGTYGNNQGYDIPLKLFPGFHTFIGMDAYGDGWNGGTYSIAQNFGAGNVVVPVTAFGPSSPAEGQLGGPPAFPGGQLGRTSLYTFETTGCSNLAIAAEAAPPVALVNEAKEEPTLEGATAGAPTAPCGGAGGPTTVQLTVHVENWSSDITWNVDGSTADGMHDGPLNYNQHDYVYSLTLDEGAHILNMNDQMGDTWNVMGGSAIQGSATTTKMDGTVFVPPTLMANGVNSMPIPFALAGATPCPIDTPALGGVAAILPACLPTGCAGANDVTENTLGAKCHFIGGFTLEEDCFATCNFGADGDAGGLQSACDALNSVDMAVATPETLAVLSDSINSGSYTTISTTAAVISE
jgi:hypothetical protein